MILFLSAGLESDPQWQDGKNKTERMEWDRKVCWEFWIQKGGSWEDHLWQFRNVENCSKLSERSTEMGNEWGGVIVQLNENVL